MRMGEKSNPPRICSCHLGGSFEQQQKGILGQSSVQTCIDLHFTSQLSSTFGPLTSFANGRRVLPAPGAAWQIPLAGDASQGWGTAPLRPAWSLMAGRERKFLCGDVEFVTGSGNGPCGHERQPRGPWRGLVKALCWKKTPVALHQHW